MATEVLVAEETQSAKFICLADLEEVGATPDAAGFDYLGCVLLDEERFWSVMFEVSAVVVLASVFFCELSPMELVFSPSSLLSMSSSSISSS